MVVKTICSLANFKLKDFSKEYRYKDFALALTDNVIKLHFFTPEFVTQIGANNFNALRNNPYFYWIVECPAEVPYGQMSKFAVDNIDQLISFLWFIKDNSCNCSLCFSYLPVEKIATILALHNVNTNCNGEFTATEFTRDELDRTVEILKKAQHLFTSINAKNHDLYEKAAPVGAGMHTGIVNKVNYNDRNRIERALLFLLDTRKTAFVPSKISMYMNIFECLFTTDSSEVIHKISERIACYLSDDKNERIDIFKLVKSAYGVRSKYFHGQPLPNNLKTYEKLNELATKIDNLTRRILTKVVMVDSEIFLKADDLDAWYNELIFR